MALTAVLVTGRLLGLLFRYVGQPPVIGEVVGGILLGPSLLGRVWPEAAAFILPPSVAPFLGVIAQLGVILYMFLVGLELNPRVLRERAHATVAISHASIIAPFLLGAALALVLYPRLSSSDVPFTSFALFLGVAMSITAFPVLARILTDRRMQRTPLGVVALGCAATDDVTAWCLLAFVVGVDQAKVGGAVLGARADGRLHRVHAPGRAAGRRALPGPARRGPPDPGGRRPRLRGLAPVRPDHRGDRHPRHLRGVPARRGHPARQPHRPGVRGEAGGSGDGAVAAGLLRLHRHAHPDRPGLGAGAVAGLRADHRSSRRWASSAAPWLAARFTGLGWREAAGLGVLMNTRGLMELIVLNIGLDLGVISPTLFAMMVLMALVTTMATTPMLHLLTPPSSPLNHAGRTSHVGRALDDAQRPTPI